MLDRSFVSSWQKSEKWDSVVEVAGKSEPDPHKTVSKNIIYLWMDSIMRQKVRSLVFWIIDWLTLTHLFLKRAKENSISVWYVLEKLSCSLAFRFSTNW